MTTDGSLTFLLGFLSPQVLKRISAEMIPSLMETTYLVKIEMPEDLLLWLNQSDHSHTGSAHN